MFRRITIRTNILTNFLFVVAVVAASLIGVQYYFARQLALEATEKNFHQIAGRVVSTFQERDKLAKETLSLMEAYAELKAPHTPEERQQLVQRLSIPMQRNAGIYAVYTGYGNGDLFEVANLESSPKLVSFYAVPDKTRWVCIEVTEGVRKFRFYDANYNLLGSREAPSDYSVLVRPWYRQALDSHEAVRSDPYLFSNLQAPGITFSKVLPEGKSVLALDFTLDTLQGLFASFKFAPGSEIALLSRDGKVIVSSELSRTKADVFLETKIGTEAAGKIIRYEQEGEAWLAMFKPLSEEAGEMTWMGFSIDEKTMIKPYVESIDTEIAVAMVVLLLTLPLVRFTTSRIVEPIKRLTDQTDKIKARRFEDVESVKTHIIELQALSHSLVSMAKSIREYQQAQKDMMDAFIKIIADAIDTKSPYTGGHCKRVPVIAMMLARAAEEQKEGAFASFALGDQAAWEAFERGAWLHDCGKITTPEYVVDKATKLETIYNRIHEVRTRFELIWRDIEIAYYERLLAGGEKADLEVWKAQEHATLLEEFTFIATANMGGEFMSEELQRKVREIGARTWVRHFDDRLGLSESELMRYEGIAERPVPSEERLLDDKPEHRIARLNFDEEAYRAQGFKTPVPELLYNYGEIYNLCQEKGTLTEEERFKINEHVIMSIKMLELLPLPENMKQIPYYAGTHHETLDGRGYPRELTRDDLSVQARIMAIADIYEALTASDRPYKKAKTVSQSLKIMSFMVKEEHIDGELFALFLHSGVYMEYARAHLKPEQIDEVEVEALLS